MNKKVIFLDRDGTINVDRGYVHKVQDWNFAAGAVEGLKMLQDAGYALAVITNQSGIAQGKYTEADMKALHEHMEKELAKQDVHLAAIAYCVHDRDQDECDCRKPKTGMAKHIEQKIGAIDHKESWTIGDKIADLGFGKTLGTKTILIRSFYWRDEDLEDMPDNVADSLLEAARKIVQNTK